MYTLVWFSVLFLQHSIHLSSGSFQQFSSCPCYSLNIPIAGPILTNWFQSQSDCCSVYYFLNHRTERRFEGFNFSEERSRTCEVSPSVKIFQVRARQLQNILIMPIIDREDRLCELMNPKGAPLMCAGL